MIMINTSSFSVTLSHACNFLHFFPMFILHSCICVSFGCFGDILVNVQHASLLWVGRYKQWILQFHLKIEPIERIFLVEIQIWEMPFRIWSKMTYVNFTKQTCVDSFEYRFKIDFIFLSPNYYHFYSCILIFWWKFSHSCWLYSYIYICIDMPAQWHWRSIQCDADAGP